MAYIWLVYALNMECRWVKEGFGGAYGGCPVGVGVLSQAVEGQNNLCRKPVTCSFRNGCARGPFLSVARTE